MPILFTDDTSPFSAGGGLAGAKMTTHADIAKQSCHVFTSGPHCGIVTQRKHFKHTALSSLIPRPTPILYCNQQ